MGTEEICLAPGGDPIWTVRRIVRYALLIGSAWLLAQVAVIVVLLNRALVANPELDTEAWSTSIGSDGFAFAVSVIAGSVAGVLATYSLVRRHEIHVWQYVGFRSASGKALFWSVVVILGFTGISDGISLAIGREVVPPFVLQIYTSSGSVALLAAVLVVVGPLAEEMMFRGFLLGALESVATPRVASVLISSGAWAIVHVQYDAYGIGTIFAMGLTLGVARLATTSILPCIAMHAVANAVSLFEAVDVAHTAV